MDLKAIIFDLDGTVVADEDEYGKAFAKVMKQFGITLDSAYPHVGGIGVEENWEIFRKKYKLRTSKSNHELGIETQREYLKLLDRITLKPGFEELVKWMREMGIIIALATSNYWHVVDKLTDRLGIGPYFDCITTAEEVRHKKPDPEIFDITAEKLDIENGRCLVFEDSAAGIEAAKSADMKVIGVYRNEQHKKSLRKADALVSDFNEITPELLGNI